MEDGRAVYDAEIAAGPEVHLDVAVLYGARAHPARVAVHLPSGHRRAGCQARIAGRLGTDLADDRLAAIQVGEELRVETEPGKEPLVEAAFQ